MKKQPVKEPSLLISLTPVMVLVGLLFGAVYIFGSDTLSGGSQIVLLIAAAVCCAIAMLCYKVRWTAIEQSIVTSIAGVSPALLLLLIIGALAGSWMISGVVPTLIYYGIRIIHPSFYLVSTCIICSIVSVMTGSSWTTVATIGIALLGIGQAQGFPPGWIAGAIISGAYFGDKVSPLSDTTILASSTTGTPLFVHIRYMMITAVPAMLLTLVIFTAAGFMHEPAATGEIALYAAALKETFTISPWLLVVPAVTGLLIIKKVPALVTLFLSAILAGALALIAQPHLLHEIAGAEQPAGMIAKCRGLLITLYGSTGVHTGNATLDSLVATSGMAGMLHTVWIIICAMAFAGAMTASGMLRSITAAFMRRIKRTAGMVGASVGSGIFLNTVAADQYIALILMGSMFRDIYREKGYESRLLSRTIEDAVTVTSPLVPWNTCGMTQSTMLGISTFAYLPYCFFNLITPVISILIAALGYKICKIKPGDPEPPAAGTPEL
ncbi:MAG: sodium:proton antiporter [Prevotellaceae bacterium]|jgi:NhaC family Na+:H+ antiporter|nr:sodium:proton antiporter [Prevotellaceae bacterium]